MLHTAIVKEVANVLTLQCYHRQEFEKISKAPPSPLSRRLRHQIERDCRRADIAVSLLRRLLCSLTIAVLPLSRIQGDCQCTAIVIAEEVAPPNQRRLLTCQHHGLATIVDEVSAQSCHCSLAAVKNLRRTKDVGGVSNNQSNRQIFGTNRRGSQTRN